MTSSVLDGAGAETASLTPALPRFAQIEPIGRCNLACKMCTVNERGDEVAEMPLARFEQLLDQMPGLQELHLQGLGEPMLHPDFFDMVALAARRGIRVSANTNLTLLTPERARRCVSSGLASLSVSLDGASAEVYQEIRRKASFAKVLRNLGRLVDARDEAGSALQVRGVMVLMRSNLEELPALVRLLHAHRVPQLLVQRLSNDLRQPELPARYIPIRNAVDEAELGPADLPRAHEVFTQARRLARELGMQLHLPRLQPRDGGSLPAPDDAPRCRWPWEQLYVTAAGELLPCCMVATADRASFGKVFDGDPGDGLLRRWHGAPAREFREALAGSEPPAVCRGCALYHGTF
ncbi:MAG TPA: radical SAM/SPASM domain-containing protein [Albitalea sp.]|nr:radical SAM/SPASM domain-containing protein [Albitalea sp.]